MSRSRSDPLSARWRRRGGMAELDIDHRLNDRPFALKGSVLGWLVSLPGAPVDR